MGKYKKRNHYFEGLLIVSFLGLLGIFYYLNFLSGKPVDRVNVLICAVQFAITFVVFSFAWLRFSLSNKIVKDLNKATADIVENKANIRLNFKTEILREQYLRYEEELSRLKAYSENNAMCDIEDYFNHDLIDVEMHRSTLNLVPGAMTGLGILGTFIGLSFGLQFFNTGTAEEISNSIAPLMDGIKVAFHTSIYGMVFSLVFNFVYKKKLEATDNAMDGFLVAFHKYIEPKPENEVINRVVTYQENQMIIAMKLADSISEAIASKISDILLPEYKKIHEGIDQLMEKAETMGENLSETLKNVLAPQFEEMNRVIDNFVEATGKSQVEGIQVVVEKFVDEMNNALGDNFKELGAVLNETCEIQRTQSGQMQEILERTDTMIIDLSKMNTMTENTISRMEAYVQKLDELQQSLNNGFDEVVKQTATVSDLLGKYQTYMDTMVAYEEQLTQTSAAFSRDLALELEKIQKLEEEVSQGAREHVEKMSDVVANCIERMEAVFTEKLTEMHKMEEMIQGASKENIADIKHQVEEYCETLANTMQEQVSELIALRETVDTNLSNTTDELNNVVSTLDGKLQDTLNRTFDLFDTNLAEISQHLSGTISRTNTTLEEMNSTTENVPRVVASAYEGMSDSFDRMQSEIDQMIIAMETLRSMIDGKLNLLFDE